MVNQDLGFRIKQISERVSIIEDQLKQMDREKNETEDWDNARLLREWGICKRTASNYRNNGLGYYRRGGRLYYTQQQRENFLKQKRSEK
jgi:hypothetical protein